MPVALSSIRLAVGRYGTLDVEMTVALLISDQDHEEGIEASERKDIVCSFRWATGWFPSNGLDSILCIQNLHDLNEPK